MIIKVNMEPYEIAFCKMMGNLRNYSCRITGTENKNHNDPYEIDENGFIGEFAFCKHFNVFPDVTAKPRSGSVDCIYRGKKFDIKTTRVKSGRLIAPYSDETEAFALAILFDTCVLLPGYIMAEEVFRPENQTGEFGDSYVVGQHRLTQWGENGR